jgi:hypothetical protein
VPIPEGYDPYTYFNQGVGDLSKINGEFHTFQAYWEYFTPQQKQLIKDKILADIDAGLAIINDVKSIIADVQV